MKQQKSYNFIHKQIILMIALSLIPGLAYLFFSWKFGILLPALLWYIFLIFISMYGIAIYKYFSENRMNEKQLNFWYIHLKIFMYLTYFSWIVVFIINIKHSEYNLHYIAIFTQLGASVVASTLLVSDKKLFVPILLTLMLPLILYFFIIGTWFGYVLSAFSIIFLGVLLYASYNTNNILNHNYYQAQHDMLTGLYNRRYFMEYIESLHQRLLDKNKIAYILLIDLDHFKNINDSLGHDVGDKLLVEVSKRLNDFSKDKYVLARLGGDEFILVSGEIDETKNVQKEAHVFATQLLDEIKKLYVIGTHHLHISASIGLHTLTNLSLKPSHFIKEADIAMYEAKNKGRDGVIVFNKSLSKKLERQMQIEKRLHYILTKNCLKTKYQPKFNSSSKVIGCEVLLYWFDNKLGEVSSREFIPIAEDTGLILELGFYVLQKTFKVLYNWNTQGYYVQNFAINISIRQLLNEPFVEEVETLMKYYFSEQAKSQKIIFELTEHIFSQDMDKVVNMMSRLEKSGITFSIDDFGMGYSSLNYLQELPIGEIKIDKAFIDAMGENGNSEKMITAIISIAKTFNLQIVSEGIKDKSQFKDLQTYGSDIFQGDYFDGALSEAVFKKKYLTKQT